MIKIILALFISFSIQAQEFVNQPFSICDNKGYFQENDLNFLSLTLSHQIIKAIENTELVYEKNSGYPFNGSLDWHSSIHAHWSLLSMARKLNRPELRDYVLDRIKNKHLKKINNIIVSKDKLAYQYALSWLLLLTYELQLTDQYDPAIIRGLKSNTLSRLREQISKNRKVSGNYESKTFTLFAAQLTNSFIADNKSLKHRRYLKRLRKYETNVFDFFNPLTMYKRLQGIDVKPEPSFWVTGEADQLYSSHYLGHNLTSVWFDLKKYEGKKKINYCRELETRINMTFTNDGINMLNKGTRYIKYDHWVPQFIWMPFHLTLD